MSLRRAHEARDAIQSSPSRVPSSPPSFLSTAAIRARSFWMPPPLADNRAPLRRRSACTYHHVVGTPHTPASPTPLQRAVAPYRGSAVHNGAAPVPSTPGVHLHARHGTSAHLSPSP
ncbi:hypothetical protein AcW1_002706 [Taiwanofungus camphoratus]|nr:hypothetical protein AcW1_002706 [Antrodia cinnamomea]